MTDTVAQIHHFEPRAYEECVKALTEFSGFVLSQAVGPEPITQEKLGRMLKVYLDNCVRKGPGEGTEPPPGSVCQHVFIKGGNAGNICGKNAKFTGVEGLPKCSSHKKSRPSKKKSITNSPSADAAGNTFSYAANVGKGKTIPQSLTTIQAAIAQQEEPAKLILEQTADGRYFHEGSNIQFEIRKDDQGNELGWVAIGVIDGSSTRLLSEMDVYVCYGNHWKWDKDRVEKEVSASKENTILVGNDHPLIQNTHGLVQKKIESIVANSNN